MGLTSSSTGINAVDTGFAITKKSDKEKVIALAGNPNVGKSTVFNALTGMNQHTGNWAGKTVTNAKGFYKTDKFSYILVDIPGTYSLIPHSAEEQVARDFICFGNPDAVAVVCDATCLQRNLGLVLQIIETGAKAVVCVNLLDEAKRKGISVDLDKLSVRLGVPVVGMVARRKKGLKDFSDMVDRAVTSEQEQKTKVRYTAEVEQAIAMIEPATRKYVTENLNSRWLSLRLLEGGEEFLKQTAEYLGNGIFEDQQVCHSVKTAKAFLQGQGIDDTALESIIATATVSAAEKITDGAVIYQNGQYSNFDRKLDKLLTGRAVGYPVMILLLLLVFWLTVSGANYPSELLSKLFFSITDELHLILNVLHAPQWVHGLLVDGMYKVLATVVSVMLPPMAIFFPLFTLLEDAGYLPRVAFNLDKPFHRCNSCGKQALTMCMGFGCNAAGIVGCRIIDSKRERLLAILTNSLVPCNGRFPTIVSIITMFFVGAAGFLGSVWSAFALTLVILSGVFATLLVTFFLSKILLKGVPSSFVLELPPYRRPQIGKVLVRSVFDRTIFVLGRAMVVAAPAGMLIWAMANIHISGGSLLAVCSSALDPLGKLLGLDGVILMAFILGFPANEIVIPIIIMAYTANGNLQEFDSLLQLKELLVANGWTWVTALCVIVFSLMHWPCSTTLMTVKKETGSFKWTVAAAIIPTVLGCVICFIISSVAKIFI